MSITPVSYTHLAFVHSSYVNEHKQLKHDNERLAFMGDAVLQLWVSDKLFRLDPPLDEGHMVSDKITAATQHIPKKMNILKYPASSP